MGICKIKMKVFNLHPCLPSLLSSVPEFTLDVSSLDFLSGVAKTKSAKFVKLVLSEVEWNRALR